MRIRIKSLLARGFPHLFSISHNLGLGAVWDRTARLDPRLRGSAYPLLVADQLCRRDRRKDAMRLLQGNMLTLLGRARPLNGAVAERGNAPALSGKPACLRDFYAALEGLSLQPFLAFGTLLGFVRENGFIRNDADIDIGILYAQSDVDRIAHALVEGGFLMTRRNGSVWPCRIKCVHPNGTKVDVVFFNRKGDKFQTYCEYKGQRIIRERTPFGLRPAEFQSCRVWIPEHPETFLDENYLDWRVPQSKSHCLFTSALTDYRQETIRYFAIRHLYELLTRRNGEDFEFYLDIFLSRNPSDPLWPEIKKAFNAGYG